MVPEVTVYTDRSEGLGKRFYIRYTKYSILNAKYLIDSFGERITNFNKVQREYEESVQIGNRVRAIIENEWKLHCNRVIV
jgi:hypothetical protein